MTHFLPRTNYRCYVIQDANTIRAYENVPAINSSSPYTDFYVNSHYMEKSGTQTWGNYNTNLPTCSSDTFTTNVFYRNDFADIMIIFFLLLLICFYFPYRLISRAFGRWLKW